MTDEMTDFVPKDLVATYLERRIGDLSRLADMLMEHDFKGIAELGHKLYGSGGAYGMPRISMLGKQLQKAARTGDPARVSEVLDTLRYHVQHEIPKRLGPDNAGVD